MVYGEFWFGHGHGLNGRTVSHSLEELLNDAYNGIFQDAQLQKALSSLKFLPLFLKFPYA